MNLTSKLIECSDLFKIPLIQHTYLNWKKNKNSRFELFSFYKTDYQNIEYFYIGTLIDNYHIFLLGDTLYNNYDISEFNFPLSNDEKENLEYLIIMKNYSKYSSYNRFMVPDTEPVSRFFGIKIIPEQFVKDISFIKSQVLNYKNIIF